MAAYNEQDLGQMGSWPESWELYSEVYNLLGQLPAAQGWVVLKSYRQSAPELRESRARLFI